MDHEKLFESVKQYSFLYNQEDKRYSDNEKKELAWKEIGKMLKTSGSECKKQWNNLRDSFRRALKKRRETKSGQAANKLKKWKFEDEMYFFLPFMKERETVSSVTVELSNDSDSNAEETANNVLPDQECDTERLAQQTQEEHEKQSKQVLIPKRRRNQPDTAAATLMKYILENKKEKSEQGVEKASDINLFFQSVAATVNKFSPCNQALAKARVFSIVSQLELEEISQGGFQHLHSRPVSTISSYTSDKSVLQPTSPSVLQPIQTQENATHFYGAFGSTLDEN